MIPKRVTLENFLSFGPKTEINFDDDEALWVLGGPNGVGKSAVFDAITYCLYGVHRGGSKGMDKLIRHGANSFRVSFQFEFQAVEYRIIRNHNGEKATQSVEMRPVNTDVWKRVQNVNAVADVANWTERTLGLGFEAFKASVLLRQGDSDAIIKAGGTERLKILKKIIGAERYEELSNRINEAKKKRKLVLDNLKSQRDGREPVSPEQLQITRDLMADAERDHANANAVVETATKQLEQARRWATLQPKIVELTRKIDAAEQRRTEGDRIRRDHERYTELKRFLPIRKDIQPLQDAVAAGSKQLFVIRQQHEEADTQSQQLASQMDQLKQTLATNTKTVDDLHRVMKDHHEEIQRTTMCLKSAEDLAALQRNLAAFSPDLDTQLMQTANELKLATQKSLMHRDEWTGLQTQLRTAEAERKRYANLAIGVTCSACGQQVTAEHADKERARTVAHCEELTLAVAAAADLATQAANQTTELQSSENKLKAETQKRETIRIKIAEKQQFLQNMGSAADVAPMKERLQQLNAEIVTQEQHRTTLQSQCRQVETELKTLTPEAIRHAERVKMLVTQLSNLERQLASDSTKCEYLQQQLTGTWATVPIEQLPALDAELQTLTTAGIVEQFRQLEQDAARREEWEHQRDELTEQASTIPGTARVPETVAVEAERTAKLTAKSTLTNWQGTRDKHAECVRRAEEFEQLRQQIVTAELDYERHDKLEKLLGKSGLQRELVRDAEEQIVRLANDTVSNLSNNDLSIELDQSESGDDKAFSLGIRRADDPTPIAVDYLSGSQKFRVSIAIALAIGRFASGQAKPLESVIIDEGFGSLDKNGLQSTADELNRLKKYLKRIVLVSHQEEFTDNFPVVIQLSHTDAGTTAQPVRRR